MHKFTGPLFLIGFGRSGTKLLRALLANHPKVVIPEVETNFLPMWLMQERKWGELSDPVQFRQFYRSVSGAPFFIHMRRRGRPADAAAWHRACDTFDAPGIFQGLIRYYTDWRPGQIWGDKSPGNTRHLALIASRFPGARFIHIVRDVRDCCLSAQKAWQSHPLRNAARWADCVGRVRAAAGALPGLVHELRYEDLLENPERELLSMCRFLGITFSPAMLGLDRNTERYGDAAGSTQIMAGNSGKFKKQMQPGRLARIEAVAWDEMAVYGYHPLYARENIPVSKNMMTVYRIHDGCHHLLRNLKEKGVRDAFAFTWRFFRMNRAVGN